MPIVPWGRGHMYINSHHRKQSRPKKWLAKCCGASEVTSWKASGGGGVWADVLRKVFHGWQWGGKGIPEGRKRCKYGHRGWHAQVTDGEGGIAWYGTSIVCWKVRGRDKILKGLTVKLRSLDFVNDRALLNIFRWGVIWSWLCFGMICLAVEESL